MEVKVSDDPLKEKSFTVLTETIQKKAKVLKVTNEEQNQQADALLQLCHSKIKEVNAYWEPIVKPLGQAHKSATSKRKAMLDPLDSLKKYIGKTMADFDTQKKLDAQKLAREALEKQNAINAKLQKELDKEKEAKADGLEAAGMKPEAEAVRKQETKAQVTMTFDSPVPVKTTKTKFREDPDPELVDIKLLAQAVANGEVASNILQMNFTVAKNLAKTLKHIPGVLLKTKKIPVA